MLWDSFSRYYEWEFDLFCNEQKKDVAFWIDCANEFGNPILELACGTGRITIPLFQAGHRVTALDNSVSMLKILKSRLKSFRHISIIKADLTGFQIDKKFKFAFISYSSLQQFLSYDQQKTCLTLIKNHLVPGGVLGLDIGTRICDTPLEQPMKLLYSDEIFSDKSRVSMYTSWETDLDKGIRHWVDQYIEEFTDGTVRKFINRISLQECNLEYMKKLLLDSGFRILNIYGSFNKDEVTADSSNNLYLAESI